MLKIAIHYFAKSVLLLMLVETTVLLVSAFAGTLIRFPDRSFDAGELRSLAVTALLFTSVMIFSMSALGMYRTQLRGAISSTIARMAPAYLMGFTLISVIYFIVPSFQVGRGVLGLVFMVSGLGICCTRLIFLKSRYSGMFSSRVLVLGAGALAKECGDLAESLSTSAKCKIIGYLRVGDEEVCVPQSQVLPEKTSLFETVCSHHVTDIVVALQNKRVSSFPISDLLNCKLNGVQVTQASDFFEREACQIRVKSLQSSWLVFGNGFDQSYYRVFCKRSFDLIVSLILAFISAPLMLLTAAMIFVEDRGPVLYSQERVGLGGRTYMVHKFRSMGCNAELAGIPQWATKADPRVTRVGGFIRKMRIDELPQIFNVLLGEMSFVGPRPERPYFVDQLSTQIPYYDVRHSIKPGITGLAQVRYAYGASVEDSLQKLQYDLYYVKNNSLFLDFLILIDTIQVVLLGKGAR